MKKLNSFAKCIASVCLIAAAVVGCEKTPPKETPVAVFEVSDAPLAFPAENPTSKEVAVKAENVAWSVAKGSADEDWLTVEKSEGKIVVSVTANDGAEARTGSVVVTPDSDKFEPVTIDVSQAGKNEPVALFEVSDSPLTFAAQSPESQEVEVSAELVEWMVEVENAPLDWLAVEKQEGKFTVMATTNETYETRQANIIVTPDNDFEPVVIAVTQAAKAGEPPIELPTEVEFNMVYSAEYKGDTFGTGAGHFTVTFMNIVNMSQAIFESFTIEGFIPIPEDATTSGFVPLPTGEYDYEFNETYTGTPFTFLSYYGVVQNAGTFYMSTLHGLDKQLFYPVYGGSVTVSDQGYGNTKITADVINDQGQPMKLTFTGPLTLDNTTVPKEAAYNATFTSCQSAQNIGQYFEQPIREFELRFTKTSTVGQDNISERLILRFNTDLDASADGQIPSGRYFPFTTEKYAKRAPYTYMRGGASFGITVGSYYVHQSELYGVENDILFDQDGGYIDVENHGNGTYTIAVRVIGTGYNISTLQVTQNVVVNCDFTGQITIR